VSRRRRWTRVDGAMMSVVPMTRSTTTTITTTTTTRPV